MMLKADTLDDSLGVRFIYKKNYFLWGAPNSLQDISVSFTFHIFTFLTPLCAVFYTSDCLSLLELGNIQ